MRGFVAKTAVLLRYIFKYFSQNTGAVALELACSVPVFMALLYYMHDVPKMEFYKSKTRFIAACAANMFQNISQKRADKRITKRDYAYISAVAPFARWNGSYFRSSMSASNPLFLHDQLVLYYVKGVGNNKVNVVWAMRFSPATPLPPERVNKLIFFNGGAATDAWCTLQVKTNTPIAASEIDKDFHLEEGEVAMILDCNLSPAGAYKGIPKVSDRTLSSY